MDLIEDVGNALSPLIDLGQVEGGFVFGLGLWTSEETKYDPDTGELLTHDTWEYKPPCSADIPEDFRITFSDPLTEKGRDSCGVHKMNPSNHSSQIHATLAVGTQHPLLGFFIKCAPLSLVPCG